MYIQKVNDLKEKYQKDFDTYFNHMKAWENVKPLYTKSGKEFKNLKKAFPDLHICRTFSGVEITVFYSHGYGHYSDSFKIYDIDKDINEFTYNDIETAIKNQIDVLKGWCDTNFRKLEFLNTYGSNLFDDIFEVLKEYDQKLPGDLKYLMYDLFEWSNPMSVLTDHLYTEKNKYSYFSKSQTYKQALEAAGFREKEILNSFDYYRKENINGRIIVTFLNSKESKTVKWDDTYKKWVG